MKEGTSNTNALIYLLRDDVSTREEGGRGDLRTLPPPPGHTQPLGAPEGFVGGLTSLFSVSTMFITFFMVFRYAPPSPLATPPLHYSSRCLNGATFSPSVIPFAPRLPPPKRANEFPYGPRLTA